MPGQNPAKGFGKWADLCSSFAREMPLSLGHAEAFFPFAKF